MKIKVNWSSVTMGLTALVGLVGLAQSYASSKILDDKVAKAVAEAMKKGEQQ